MSSEQELKCVFCSEKFSQKEELQIHFRKHADPNFNQKKTRGRSYDDSDTSTEKLKDQVEVVECDVCSEVFSSISKAITHKHKIHPDHDTKYFCPWCGKLFTMKHLYKKHMLAAHLKLKQSEERHFHCDSCDVDFYVPSAMLYHNKFYHRQDELPNLGHSKKLKMILEEVVQIYYCPFCGEEHENKVNLHKHINEDHAGENRSPDDVFRCPLCDGIFFYLDAYELHLTYHSIEDLYTERNEMMDAITDFSLETVQPLQEKVENADANNDRDMGIEGLLEFTMNDSDCNRKSKKHKKHKKSKKPAITLDEFLNMNTDVFGEGLDFQGIEEVPTQAIAKRFKTKKLVPGSKSMTSDLAKLKKQGIVVKKQSTKVGKPVIKKNVAIKSANIQKTTNPPQTKSNALTSTDAVLSKLLNQGSQIKIVKKNNQDSEEQKQGKEEKKSPETAEAENNEDNPSDNPSELNKIDKHSQTSKQNTNIDSPKINNVKLKSQADSLNPESPSLLGNNRGMKPFQDTNDDSNHSSKSDERINMAEDLPETAAKLSDNIMNLQNNSSITMKLPKQVPTTTKEDLNSTETNHVGATKIKDPDSQENTQENSSASASGNASFDALKHLSHLITIKSVNSSKAIPLPYYKTDKNSNNAEIVKALPVSQKDSPKLSEVKQFPNIKNLDGITIRSTNTNNTKNDQSMKSKDDLDEDHETDDEWLDEENEMDSDKLPLVEKGLPLTVETKHSSKTLQKESPKGILNNDHNSQSSVDLLKHLKNVTAKPIITNSQKLSTPHSSPKNVVNKAMTSKAALQKEISADGTEIFSIEDSDSDEGHATSNTVIKNENINTVMKNESKVDKIAIAALKNANKNITIKSTSQQSETTKNNLAQYKRNEESDLDEEFDQTPSVNDALPKFNSPKLNQKNLAINNVLKNLSRNITVKSRNSSPSQSARVQDQNSIDTHQDKNEVESDSDTPLSRVKITEMDNMSEDEFLEDVGNDDLGDNVKVEHPNDSHSDHDEVPADDDDDMSDIESQIAAAKVQKSNLITNSKLSQFKNPTPDISTTSPINTATDNNEHENPPTEIPAFAKNLSNQISIKQIKKPESRNPNVVEQAGRSINQSSVSKKIATSSNQVKEVKTVKTFQTQTKTVIQEITTTVTKTIKTVNQATHQEVRNMTQSSPMIKQKIQGVNPNLCQKNMQGVKVRQSVPSVRPKIRGQAPQTIRPAICAPPQTSRPAICAPVRANQLVPTRPAFNRPSGPRSRMPNVMNMRPSTSGQHRPQMSRPVKVSHRLLTPPKKPTEPPGHFSCFKKPKESLIPELDFSPINKNDEDASAQFSSTLQMSKSDFSSTSKTVKGNSVITSTQMKSEMSASSQQLSKLRGMSGLVVKTSQSQAKQSHVEEKCEISASKRNALEAIQKLQSQGLLVKKPRLDISEDSEHSQHGSDDVGNVSNEEFD